MAQGSSLSPLIIKYEDILERNPRSQVFAPLGESYRKLGLVDKALGLFKQGIHYHPDYIMGYLGLAACYLDESRPQLAYSILRPMVESHRDNLKLQKLFAEACLKLDIREEALETYQYILFLNPKDREAVVGIEELELKTGEEKVVQFDLSPLDSDPQDNGIAIKEWVQVDLVEGESNGENWSVEKPNFDPPLDKNDEKPESEGERELDLTPVVTHTLVDLYIQQGYLGKARETLKKLLEIKGEGEKTNKKWRELELLLEGQGEEKGRQNLMGLFEQAASRELLPYRRRFESFLWNFNNAIQRKIQKLEDS